MKGLLEHLRGKACGLGGITSTTSAASSTPAASDSSPTPLREEPQGKPTPVWGKMLPTG